MCTTLLILLTACGSSPMEAPAPSTPPAAEVPLPVPAAPKGPLPVDLRVPPSVGGMAARLTELETMVRDPSVDPAQLGDVGHAQQRIIRAMAGDPVASKAVLAELGDELRPGIEKMVNATATIARLVPVPKSDLPNWRMVDPKPAAELLGYYRESQEAHGVPWQILAAIHLNETRMGRLRGTSVAGAMGPMQFMPKTWEAYGEGDIHADRDAIMAAGNYLKASGWATDPDKAIWAYNHSNHYVNAVKGYAELMEAEPRRLYAFWGWQVYYRTVEGAIWLRTGYDEKERIPIAKYCDQMGEPYCPKVHRGP